MYEKYRYFQKVEGAAPSLLLRAWLFFHNDVPFKWFMVYEMFYAV